MLAKKQEQPDVRMILHILNHEWFDGRFSDLGTVSEFSMPLLLLNAYFAAQRGWPLNRRRAAKLMRVRHFMTAKNVINRAVEMGLLRIEKNQVDRRLSLLVPTPKLDSLISEELGKFI